ncbi:MAG: prolipoprotein diacylglyceryl transferase [Candidatus Gastranaerophilales bacterium]|nr:prolipoprotein diacylglyceryl transferase [Candidatus Gastranaerophilales bacterium]
MILAFAIFIGIVTANKIALKEYFMPAVIPNIATSVVIGGIVGARLYYCLLNYNIYLQNPIEIFAIREGGLTIHGAILGGLIVLIYQAKKNRIELLKLCDIFAMGLPIAQAIGRWGNFFNSEAFGLPTDLPWKLFIKQPYRPDEYFSNQYFHPTFLYESILDIFIFIILYYLIVPKNKDNYGYVSAWYLLLYSIVRFFIEFLRVDCVKYIYGIPVPQIVSIVIIVLALGFIIKNNKNKS